MTLEEKIDMLHGEFGPYVFYNEPIERLGIPALAMDDGPAGVRITNPEVNGGKATAFPAPIALASTWDPEMALRFGDVISEEAFNTGHNVLLAPAVDIARVPLAGRVFEAFGEDPLIQAKNAVAVTRGIQRHPVSATVKHYNVYNQETDRFFVSANIGERALQEIYTTPFEAAVEQARPGAIMCAYNRVNGVFGCENRRLLTGILKRQLGFRGWVMSDFAATSSTVKAARAGLDQEMPSEVFFGDQLLAAVRSGAVSRTLINDKVLRILREMFRLGLFDQPVRFSGFDERAHGAFARQVAERAAVLLKNARSTLPLSAEKLGSVAVIGADADNASAAGGGSSHVDPTYTVSPLQGIRRRVGAGVTVAHAPGTDPVSAVSLLPGPPPVPSSVLSPPGAEPSVDGLRARYWTNTQFAGQPALVRNDLQAAANLGLVFAHPALQASSLPTVPFELIGTPISVRWTGTITAPATGTYDLSLTSLGSSRVFLDGKLLVDHSGRHDLETRTASVRLVAGEPHAIRVDYAADHPSV
ncbi:MAG TPA: glycoside hydrolase family 3 N-terminal domain-containing protein, partial [Actinomycetota bacterium]|nr:glycoside hydrolase family 3 N-terminal domain-containing protein [Actinomycetota bacterium]